MVPGGLFGWSAGVLATTSVLTCGALLLGGWRRRPAAAAAAGVDAAPVAASLMPFVLGRAPFAGTKLDLMEELRAALHQVAPAAAQHHVRLELAVPPALAVHADPQALRAVLCRLADHALRQTPGGHVLLSAGRLGGSVQIAVLHDGPASPPVAVQQAALRDVAQVVALQGGTFELEARPGEGIRVLVRLPELVPAAPHPAAAEVVPRHAPAAREPRGQRRDEIITEPSWDP